MRIAILTFLLIWSAGFSCDKENDKEIIVTRCSDGSPIEEWINEIKNNCTGDDHICDISILQGFYQNQPVFFTSLNGALCDQIFYVALKNCNGDTIKEYKFGDQQRYANEVDSVKVIFTCPN